MYSSALASPFFCVVSFLIVALFIDECGLSANMFYRFVCRVLRILRCATTFAAQLASEIFGEQFFRDFCDAAVRGAFSGARDSPMGPRGSGNEAALADDTQSSGESAKGAGSPNLG